MLCNTCGRENSSDVIVCSNCEPQLSSVQAQTPPPLTPANISQEGHNVQYGSNSDSDSDSDSDNADTLLAAFVGEKYDSYYRGKWFEDSEAHLVLDKKDTERPKSNIAGALLGIFWLGYRKMYKVAFFMMLGMTIVDIMLMYMLDEQVYNVVSQPLLVVAGIVVPGLFGNFFYFNHSVKHINKLKASISDPTILQERLAKEGGTSWLGSIGFAIVLVAMTVLASYFFAPDWYWVM